MKKLLLMKTMLLLCALIVGSSSVWAEDTWEETALADLTSSDVFVIVGTNANGSYAMTNDKGTSNPPLASSVTIANGEITSAVAGNMKWNLTGNATDGYTFYPNGNSEKWLYCTSTNNGVRVGTNSNNTFKIDSESGYLKHVETSRYVGIYNSADWRCYTSINANIKNQSFKFYKKVADATPTCDTPTFSPIAGVYTSAQDVTISTTTEGATIYYTTNGDIPTTSSTEYTDAINVSATTTIKAIAVKDGNNNSEVATANYVILAHAGTQADPYNVADARAAIDANIGITSVYATGIVSEIVTAWDSDHENISFNISTDGSTTSDQLQAYRCVSSTTADASTVQVGDIVVISGNLVKFGSTYEFAQGNELVSLTPDPRVAATLSWSASEVEINKGATDSEYTLPTLNNPQSVSPITYTITGTDDLAIEDEGDILVDTGVEGSVTVTASFAGNATYKPANASYTITVVDKTKKGSVYNPYTVAEVIDGTAKGSDYVIGYIVGCYENGSKSNFSRSGVTNTNLALADDPDESNVENTIAIQLPKGSVREKYNVHDNPSRIGVTKVVITGSIDSYITDKGIKSPTITTVSETIKVTSAGLATFASEDALDFTSVDGIEAYIAKEESGAIKLHKVNKVPAETGVLLRSVAGGAKAADVPVATTTDDVTNNIFVRGTGAAVASTEGGKYNYVLGKHDGVVGFYKAGGMVVATNKAYLQTTIAAARIDVNFDETTALTLVNSEKRTVNSDVFDLQGRKVANPTKGLYIVNGRKVIIK